MCFFHRSYALRLLRRPEKITMVEQSKQTKVARFWKVFALRVFL